jgi:hypothetical protein
MDVATLRRADPDLSRYDPLERIVVHDDFDRGMCGWTQLVGNYEQTLDAMLPGYAQHTGPMLSNLANWESGTHGSYSGTYAMKIQTRPRRGARNVAIKRLTFRKLTRLRLEFHFTFKPEANELRLSETDVRSVGFLYDLQHGDRHDGPLRVMPHVRFLNALDGQHLQKWQTKPVTTAMKPLGTEGKTVTHDHLAPDGWVDVPGAEQKLCYNEIPTKVNWHYVRFDFDLATMSALELQCNDRVHDMREQKSIAIPAMRNLWCMLNIAFFAETDVDKRTFLYVDGVCLSGDA